MKRNYKTMITAELVQEFTHIALEQEHALIVGRYSKYNRLFDRMHQLKKELKSRPGDQRHALIPLCDHENALVQLKAAIAVLALAPERARQTLQIVKDRKHYPAGPEAYGMLRALDRGTFVPD